jgi:DNA recombination protein RmuC
MNNTEIVAIAAISFGAGIIVTWLIVKAQWSRKYFVLDANFNSLKEKHDTVTQFIANSESAMKASFGSLAAEALQSNNQLFVTLAESKLSEKVTEAKGLFDGKEKQIDNIVTPLKESLTKMDEKINALETKREGAYEKINGLLDTMKQTTIDLGKGTQNLVNALKISSTRGKYGEIGLRRVVEFAGMTEHCDFLEQPTANTEQGLLKPDMIIHLPENKTIVVDAKTPLDAYMKVFETDSEEEKQVLLVQHAKAVKDHLKQLSAKQYWSQFTDSPDYVILYMQIESSFGAALQTDPTLIEEGIRNNIILATPTTLITLLRTVGFVWQQRSVAENIEEIRDTGIELYNRASVLLKHFNNIGGGLKSAVTHFNNAVASLESRFIPQGKRLHSLGSAYTKNIIPDIEPVEIAVREVAMPEGDEQPESSNL